MFNLKQFLGLSFFTSELDTFLKEYDQRHPQLSAAQRFEKEKYDRIFNFRDNPNCPPKQTHFWDKF